jgi:hypothetical protein
MVLRPQLPKIALLIASATTFVAPLCRVMSSPNYKPILFSDVDRYEGWHGAMQDEIQTLRSNYTWSLVPFHLSMNVVGSDWVYTIKRYVDGSFERYKTQLVAKGFT